MGTRTRGHGRVYHRGQTWYADYTDHRGDRQRHALPDAHTEQEAIGQLYQLREEQRLIRRGVLDELSNRVPVADLLEAFILHKLDSRRYPTATYYAATLGTVLGRFHTDAGKVWPPEREAPVEQVRAMHRTWTPGALEVESIHEITPEAVELYVEALRHQRSIRTCNKAIGALKAFLSWAVKARRIKSNVLAGLSKVGKPVRGARALDEAEVGMLLNASPEPYRTLWLAFLTTGLRSGELRQLRWEAVDFATNTIRVYHGTSKSCRQRDVPILAELRARLKAIRAEATDPDALVFTNTKGRPWRRGGIAARLNHWLALAGIARPHTVTPHSLRHTYATQLLLNGVNPKVVSDLLGHASIAITLDIYGHVFPRNKQEAAKALPYGQGFRVTPESHVADRYSQSQTG